MGQSADLKTLPLQLNIFYSKKKFMAVQKGDTVKIHYHGRLTDGTVFDSSTGREPLEFEVGGGNVIPGFDKGVQGMQIGDKKTIEIPFPEAYGPVDPTMILEFPKSQLPSDMNPEIGLELAVNDEAGNQYPVVITEIKSDTIILDANHPLAGKDLIFDLELMDVLQ